MLFDRYQGHIGAYLIIGGVDFDGPQLYSIAAHGSTDKVPFTAMGSGMLSATSILVSFLPSSLYFRIHRSYKKEKHYLQLLTEVETSLLLLN